jgi:hypothetical protein
MTAFQTLTTPTARRNQWRKCKWTGSDNPTNATSGSGKMKRQIQVPNYRLHGTSNDTSIRAVLVEIRGSRL